MALRYDYPTAATATVSWVPSVDPMLPRSEPDDYSVVVTRLTDRKKVHVEQTGRFVREWVYRWNCLVHADRTSHRTFVAALLAAGAARFDLTEPETLEIVPVQFGLFRFDWERSGPGLLSCSQTILEVDSA